MTDTSSLSHLIERLEKATGPDKSLDAEINLEVFTQIALPDAPPYTSSIDAAMTLVPDGFFWAAAHGNVRPQEPLGAARIFDPANVSKHIAEAEAETVPLAICIAALKARSLPQIESLPANDSAETRLEI